MDFFQCMISAIIFSTFGILITHIWPASVLAAGGGACSVRNNFESGNHFIARLSHFGRCSWIMCIYIYTYVYNYSHTMCIYTMIKYLSKLSIRYTKKYVSIYIYVYIYVYIYMYKLWKLALSLHSLASSGRWSAHSCHPLHDDDNILERICPAHLAGQLPGVYTWRVYSDHLF